MIFVNTAEHARLLHSKLTDLNIQCIEYHSLLNSATKERNFIAFQNKSERILICTDSASRGWDLSHVEHVIQAEFALNVVQHLHRIGRASRAGKLGIASNIYDDSSELLVSSILSHEKNVDLNSESTNNSDSNSNSNSNSTLETSFSRRRGMRRTMKKQIKSNLVGNDDRFK
jgi:superfamily II DNA/RNA helicase